MLGSMMLAAGRDAAGSPIIPDAGGLCRRRALDRALVNENYAYLERFRGRKMPISEKLRARGCGGGQPRRADPLCRARIDVLADHHAITGASLKDSWGLVPSYSDLWIEKRATDYAITAVRPDTPASKAGIAPATG